jgi:transcriptional regulator with XRE-family HTH domain
MDLSDCTDLLETYRRQFHVTQEQFARLTGISDQSFSQWGQGASPSPKERKAFVESDRLLHGLARVMEGIQIGSWLVQRILFLMDQRFWKLLSVGSWIVSGG